MSNIQNVSFQGRVPQNEKRNNTKWALLSAPLITASNIATGAFLDQGVKADTFKETAKNCVAKHAGTWKDLFSGGAKYILRQDKWADKIFKLKNTDKRLVAAAVIVDMLAMAGITKLSMDCISRFKHRKDA